MKPFGLTSFAGAALSTLFATQVTATLQPIVTKVRTYHPILGRVNTWHGSLLTMARDLTSSMRTEPSSSSAVSHINKM
jgi:hypothetical protein